MGGFTSGYLRFVALVLYTVALRFVVTAGGIPKKASTASSNARWILIGFSAGLCLLDFVVGTQLLRLRPQMPPESWLAGSIK